MTSERAKAQSPRSLSGLLPFLRPYRGRIALAVLFLVMAAASTLAFPLALRGLIDGGMASGAASADKGQQIMALREHFIELFAVAVALGVFSAARFYMVSWLGERVTSTRPMVTARGCTSALVQRSHCAAVLALL